MRTIQKILFEEGLTTTLQGIARFLIRSTFKRNLQIDDVLALVELQKG